MHRILRLLRYVRPYGLHLLASVLLMALVGLFDAFRVLLIRPIFDRVLDPTTHTGGIDLFTIPGTNHSFNLQQFVPSHFHNDWTVVAFALVAGTVLKGICDYLGTYLVNYAGFGMITDLRNDLYDAVLRRSVGFFGRHSTGNLLSTIINDIERVQFAMSSVLGEFLQQLFTLIFTAGVVIVLGGKLAWVLVLFIPFIVFSAGKIGRRVRTTTRKGQDKLADIQHILHETITGNRIVKAFGMESWELARFRGAARKLFRANLRSVRAQALSSPLMDIIGAVAIAMLLMLGRDKIKTGLFTAGGFLTFIVAVFKLYDPVRKFAQFNNNFQQAMGASSEIFKFMDAQDDVKERPGALALNGFKDSVRFENVGFSYTDDNGRTQQIIRNVNLNVQAGEVIAFVGSSGAGKTTLANLIPRFFDVDGAYDGNGNRSGGRLLIDGHDLRDLTLASLRAQIGIVTQETILFNDTVRNNIAYGQPGVSNQRVIDAAKAALAHDFIMRMPNGYDSVIGERGTRLSGGERQRVAIARALLKNAPILILDEATSSLDTESESLVQSALQNLMEGRTVFVIAHRLSTVRHASRIVVLEKGTIADEGSHDELVARLGTYKRLYDLQFVDIG
ncbi:MAG: Lipid export ATP-binding/permease protein MsbA [Acidobacteriaceae bacterium]|nr:Lipid export ATP-binding/permease protein MsbA [Acidobacteriaceae bacterium]